MLAFVASILQGIESKDQIEAMLASQLAKLKAVTPRLRPVDTIEARSLLASQKSTAI